MTAAVGRAWGWVCSLGGTSTKENPPPVTVEEHKQMSQGSSQGWTSWIWGGWRRPGQRASPVEEFWEAQEKLEVEVLRAGKQDPEPEEQGGGTWWSRVNPVSYLWRSGKAENKGRRRRRSGEELDGDCSDYGTPPPSPTPSSPLTSPFRLFTSGLKVNVLPEHQEICFNFLRHLFDLCVVGFLWAVSPPAQLVLEVLGVQGPLRLWLHGMAMFVVSTLGMAALLWLIQEYLPQFALVYGIAQALVISISVRQSVLLATEQEPESEREREADQEREPEGGPDSRDQKQKKEKSS